jgi:hypothetical protein
MNINEMLEEQQDKLIKSYESYLVGIGLMPDKEKDFEQAFLSQLKTIAEELKGINDNKQIIDSKLLMTAAILEASNCSLIEKQLTISSSFFRKNILPAWYIKCRKESLINEKQ